MGEAAALRIYSIGHSTRAVRCHRSLIAYALTVRGLPVEHVLDVADTEPHTLTQFARVEGTRITYPGQARLPFDR